MRFDVLQLHIVPHISKLALTPTARGSVCPGSPSLIDKPRLAAQVLTSSSEIEMWGDGKQTRSFTFIDDCVEGILRVTKSDVKEVGIHRRHAASGARSHQVTCTCLA